MRPKPEQLKLKMSNQIETIPKEMVTTPDGALLSSLNLRHKVRKLKAWAKKQLHFSLDYKKKTLSIN